MKCPNKQELKGSPSLVITWLTLSLLLRYAIVLSHCTATHPLIKRQQGQQLVLGPLVLGGHFATICSGGPLHLDPALPTFTPQQPST